MWLGARKSVIEDYERALRLNPSIPSRSLHRQEWPRLITLLVDMLMQWLGRQKSLHLEAASLAYTAHLHGITRDVGAQCRSSKGI